MNLLKIVCDTLNIDPYEEWIGTDSQFYMLKEDGKLLVKDQNMNTWRMASAYSYMNILNGKLREEWYPEIGTSYYISSINNKDKYIKKVWEADKEDILNQEKGIAFKTKKQAIEATSKMLNFIKEEENDNRSK